MNQQVTIEVKRKYLRHKIKLHTYGFSEVKKYTFEKGVEDDREIRKIERYVLRNKKSLKVHYGTFGKRSSDYRKQFFLSTPPSVGNRYFCVYCGRLLPKKKVTVDHLYPVIKVDSSVRLQKKLSDMGYSSVNDPRNLVAACDRCNKRKASKMGLWIVRGEIGKSSPLWLIRWGVRAMVSILLLSIAFYQVPEMLRILTGKGI